MSAGDGVLDVPNLACSPAIGGRPPSSSSAQSKFPDADNDACRAIILTIDPNAEYRAHYLRLLHGCNGLVGNYPFAMGCLDCRGGDFRLGHLVLRNFQPLLTVPKSRVIELALLHEVETPRRRCLPIKTSSSNTGLFFRWFRYLRFRLFRDTNARFALWCRESICQFNESRVCSKLKWSRDETLRFE